MTRWLTVAYVAAGIVALRAALTRFPPGEWSAGASRSQSKHRVILREWLAEAVAMWGLAAFVIAVTTVVGNPSVVATMSRVVAAPLLVLVC
jgi:hypothetical protein